MPDCKKLDTRLVIVNNDKYYFKGTKTSVIRAGWKTIYEYLAHGDDEDEEEEEEQEEKKAPTELQFDDKLLYEQVFEPEEEGTEEEDVDAVMFATYDYSSSPLCFSFCKPKLTLLSIAKYQHGKKNQGKVTHSSASFQLPLCRAPPSHRPISRRLRCFI